MIAELYDYGIRHGIAKKEGVLAKKIDAEVHLFSSGKVEVTVLKAKDPGRERLCLDNGSNALSVCACNFPSEKAGILFPALFLHEKKEREVTKKEKKKAYYYETLKNLSSALPQYQPFCDLLSQKEIQDRITEKLIEKNIRSDKKIAFIYDGREIDDPSDKALLSWWNGYRKEEEEKSEKQIICGASGRRTASTTKTFGKVHTLASCGGHASGDVLMGYSKASFESYGLKGNENSGMSEEAVSIVNATFEQLSESAPILSGKKWVSWYSDDVPVDIIKNLEEPADEMLDSLFEIKGSPEESLEIKGESDEDRKSVEKKTKEMILSVKSGKGALSADTRYYLACVSGASGRVRYHAWYTGQYADLYHNLKRWWEDLSMPMVCEKRPKLVALERAMFRPPQSGETDYYDSMRKRNGEKGKDLIEAALFHKPIPYSIALSTYQNIRRIIIASNSSQPETRWDRRVPCECFALLQAYLIRKRKIGGNDMTKKKNTDCQAYHWGRAFAVYERTKNLATGFRPGIGVAEKYFDSASRTPFKVGRSLESEFHHHLEKIENVPTKIYLERTLSDIFVSIGDGSELTRPLSQEEQFLFTLGFRQQAAEMNKKKEEKEEK